MYKSVWLLFSSKHEIDQLLVNCIEYTKSMVKKPRTFLAMLGRAYNIFIKQWSEKGTQKGKYTNPKVQKCRRCDWVISRNRIIQKSKSSNMQSSNIKKIYAAFGNDLLCKQKILFLII